MSPSLSERAIRAIVALLRTITIENGYETDAGKHVFRARRSIAENELPAIDVWEDGEQPDDGSGQSRSFVTSLSLSIEGHVKADHADTGVMLGSVKADIKKAILLWSGIRDLNGTLGPLIYLRSEAEPRRDGASSEAVVVKVQINYAEAYGNPYSNTSA